MGERGAKNSIEDYEWDEKREAISVSFKMQTPGSEKTTELLQRAKVVNEAQTQWSLSPKVGFYLPLGISYLVLDCAPDYSYTVVGVPDRSYIWIMGREQHMDATAYDHCLKRAKQCGYDTSKIVRVVHDTKETGEVGAAAAVPAKAEAAPPSA